MRLNKELFDVPKSLNNLVIKGLNDTSFCHYINEIFNETDRNIIVITPTLFEANRLLNILSSFIGENERIITIEDAAELKLKQKHVISLETRVDNYQSKNSCRNFSRLYQ